MGYKQSPALIVVALLLLATATPLAYGQLILYPIGFVTGTICCTSSGNCPPGAVGIPGVAVSLNCTTLEGDVVTLSQGVTNSTGVFNLTLPTTLVKLGTYASNTTCNVVANLPLNSTIYPNGTLTGVTVILTPLPNKLYSRISNIILQSISKGPYEPRCGQVESSDPTAAPQVPPETTYSARRPTPSTPW